MILFEFLSQFVFQLALRTGLLAWLRRRSVARRGNKGIGHASVSGLYGSLYCASWYDTSGLIKTAWRNARAQRFYDEYLRKDLSWKKKKKKTT